jgi:hypothetical protein
MILPLAILTLFPPSISDTHNSFFCGVGNVKNITRFPSGEMTG